MKSDGSRDTGDSSLKIMKVVCVNDSFHCDILDHQLKLNGSINPVIFFYIFERASFSVK